MGAYPGHYGNSIFSVYIANVSSKQARASPVNRKDFKGGFLDIMYNLLETLNFVVNVCWLE